jgi:hypothetical protein
MHVEIWYTMTIASSVMKPVSTLLCWGNNRWCPLIVRSSYLDEVLNEFTELINLIRWCASVISPSEEEKERNYIYGMTTHLIIIHTNELCMIGSSEVQERNQAEYFGDGSRHYEHVGAACTDVRKLDIELLVVVVDPPALDSRVDTIERDDIAGRK